MVSGDSINTKAISNDSPPANRVEGLWFADGNLVIEADNILFRVYSGLLASKSSVFRDMIAFPQPLDAQQAYSCPTVQLHDSGDDLTSFLKAIFDPEFFEPPPSKTELKIVSGILRLSSKYDVPFLRKRALLHLETTYPMTLDGWSRRDTLRSIPPVDNTPFAVLSTIREFDVLWALPAVLYCLSSYNVTQILDGESWLGQHLNINSEDQRKALIGRAELVVLQNKLSLRFLRVAEVEGCAHPTDCVETRLRWLTIVASWDTADPLDLMDENWESLKDGLCNPCYHYSQSKFRESREAIWEDLPRIFGLPSWEELAVMRARMME